MATIYDYATEVSAVHAGGLHPGGKLSRNYLQRRCCAVGDDTLDLLNTGGWILTDGVNMTAGTLFPANVVEFSGVPFNPPGAGHVVQPQDRPWCRWPTPPALPLVGGSVNNASPLFAAIWRLP